MAGPISWELDANGSLIGGGNPGGAYALSSANGWALLSFSDTGAEQDVQWASSADTEGELRASARDRNRTITGVFRLAKTTDALLESEFAKLDQKMGKIRKDGGTIKVTYPSTTVGYFDARAASSSLEMGHRFTRISRTECQVTIVCGPYIRIAEADLGDNTETTLPVLVFSDTIPGTVDALGRAVVDDDSGNDQWFMVWGVEDDSQYAHTTTSGSGSLWYEAESRTVLGGATAVAGPSGASGAGSNVVRQGTLTPAWQAMLSTQATGGGSHLSHVGVFNVWARIQMPTTNTGAVSVAFEYAQGDFRKKATVGTVSFAADHAREGQWIFQRLGQITIQKVATGTHRWEGRIIAKSTVVGDDLDVDWIGFWPTMAYGEASGVVTPFTPTSFVARDEFTGTTAAAVLNARVAPVGGTWATSGAATDWTFVDTTTDFDEHVQRTAAGTRYAILGSTDYTNVAVHIKTFGYTREGTCVARWTDSSNYLAARVSPDAAPNGGRGVLSIRKFVAGVETVIATTPISGLAVTGELTLLAYANGRVTATAYNSTGVVIGTVTAWDSVLVTAGTLATGKPGFLDLGNAIINNRIDDFWVAVPPADAAVFASQSLELRHDSVLREDSSGTYWNRVTSTPGDYLQLPPAGQEGRSTRMIIKLCRTDPDTLVDPGIDDLSARLFATGRFLGMPD